MRLDLNTPVEFLTSSKNGVLLGISSAKVDAIGLEIVDGKVGALPPCHGCSWCSFSLSSPLGPHEHAEGSWGPLSFCGVSVGAPAVGPQGPLYV